ncbi:ABC-2 type transport system ATP-binding protein [Deinobacterium chartae]|uniref:ABC-2 type transport system ATP-binding protein n=1 Tax=Deinobacterium chartae TaxID=521158 RepID=A0A841HW88_9DEIO|nr:ABC transporter ATP-binding protein [Deinobacterium chartae]MBB6097801.1 ABC-2 type transport system ATP-binding protein [Deinobacterium chartae]
MNALELQGVSKRFGGFEAVTDVSFTLRRGEIVGFLGPNGAGKTTTMRMVAGLIRPSSGSIVHTGRMSAMIEEPSFYPYLSGLENLRYAASLAGLPQRVALPALERVGLGERRHQRVAAYSQGMRQRLGLARTLMNEPELLLLDEPTNGLDPQGVAEMRELIRDIAHDGVTVLLSSHILSEVEKLAPRVLIIHKGRLKADGAVRELFEQLGAEALSVVIDTPQPERARSLLSEQPWVAATEIRGSTLSVTLPHAHLERVAPLLVGAGVPLLGLRPDVESLETVYLRVVGAGPAPVGAMTGVRA